MKDSVEGNLRSSDAYSASSIDADRVSSRSTKPTECRCQIVARCRDRHYETICYLETPLDMREKQRAGPAAADKVLLKAVQRGDHEAFGRLYELHVRDVYRYALRMLRDTTGAEDITQDVFALTWAKKGEIEIADRSLLPWLLVTTRNLSLNRLKKSNRSASSVESADAIDPRPGPEAAALDRQLAESIKQAVAHLTDSDQKLYRMCLVNEVSYRDAAAELGTTTGAVRNRLSRLRRALQISLATHKEGLS
jgi:RNA polymerase sigma factor (sigma-70 family)